MFKRQNEDILLVLSWKTKMGQNCSSVNFRFFTVLSLAAILVSTKDHLSLHSKFCLIIAINSWNKL